MEELLFKIAQIDLCLESINYNSKKLTSLENIYDAVNIANEIIRGSNIDSLGAEVTRKSLDVFLSSNESKNSKVTEEMKNTIIQGLYIYKAELSNKLLQECIEEPVDDIITKYGEGPLENLLETLERRSRL